MAKVTFTQLALPDKGSTFERLNHSTTTKANTKSTCETLDQ